MQLYIPEIEETCRLGHKLVLQTGHGDMVGGSGGVESGGVVEVVDDLKV